MKNHIVLIALALCIAGTGTHFALAQDLATPNTTIWRASSGGLFFERGVPMNIDCAKPGMPETKHD